MRFLLTLGLISLLSLQSFALTEEEEFELYKEFKAKKQAEKQVDIQHQILQKAICKCYCV